MGSWPFSGYGMSGARKKILDEMECERAHCIREQGEGNEAVQGENNESNCHSSSPVVGELRL